MVDSLSMTPRTHLLLILGAVLIALGLGNASAQTADPQGPVLVYQNIEDGATLNELPLSIQLCFKEPINIKDLDKGGDFAFTVTQPDGIGLGHRDIFQPDGYGVAVQPGNPVGENTSGDWTFTYRVTTPDARHATEGTIKYTIDPNGEPAPRVSPPACVPTGGTATASPPAGATITPPSSATAKPTPTSRASGSPSPSATRAAEGEDGNDGLDATEIGLITIGVVGALLALTLIGYFVRRAIGFDWHKPGSGGDSGHH
jgi:methionine-rich copper-binding protein CopC